MAHKAKIWRIIWRVKKQNAYSEMPQFNEFGRGFNESSLRNISLLYHTYPKRDVLRHELSWTQWTDNLRNCILVVYQLAFDDVTCYNAVSSNLVMASPCGAANFISRTPEGEIL